MKVSAFLKSLGFSIQKHFIEHRYIGRILLENAHFDKRCHFLNLEIK